MHDVGRLFARREEPPVRHALDGDAERAEPARDPKGRTRRQRGPRERRHRLPEVREHPLHRDVLREVTAPVRRHQHLRPEPHLAFEDEAAEAALGRDGRGEHPRRAAADNRKRHGDRREYDTTHQALPFRRLQSAQSIWQFSAVVLPPFDHGVMWSACICSIANVLPHLAHTPFCRS